MRFFELDIPTLVRMALPPILRTASVMTLLDAASTPIGILFQDFAGNRQANIYRVNATPQVTSLEKLLNDRYDDLERRISITDGEIRSFFFTFNTPEQRPVWLRTASEEQGVKPLFNDVEYGLIGTSFTVHVPTALAAQVNTIGEIGAVVSLFKLAGKSFDIAVSQ